MNSSRAAKGRIDRGLAPNCVRPGFRADGADRGRSARCPGRRHDEPAWHRGERRPRPGGVRGSALCALRRALRAFTRPRSRHHRPLRRVRDRLPAAPPLAAPVAAAPVRSRGARPGDARQRARSGAGRRPCGRQRADHRGDRLRVRAVRRRPGDRRQPAWHAQRRPYGRQPRASGDRHRRGRAAPAAQRAGDDSPADVQCAGQHRRRLRRGGGRLRGSARGDDAAGRAAADGRARGGREHREISVAERRRRCSICRSSRRSTVRRWRRRRMRGRCS